MMTLIIKIILFVCFLLSWALIGFSAAYSDDRINETTKKEFYNARWKTLYLFGIALEGPFIFLRKLK